jgi:hypothetical protein
MSTETVDSGAIATYSADADQPAEDTNARTGTTRPGHRVRRGDHRNNNNNNNNNRNTYLVESTPGESKFTGRCDKFKGEVYDRSEFSQVDGYTKTTKEVAEYV